MTTHGPRAALVYETETTHARLLTQRFSPSKIQRCCTLTNYPIKRTYLTRQIHFKNNRGVGGAAFAYDMGGSGSSAKAVGDASGRTGGGGGAGGGAAGGAGGGGGGVAGGDSAEVEETLQDAILAEKVVGGMGYDTSRWLGRAACRVYFVVGVYLRFLGLPLIMKLI